MQRIPQPFGEPSWPRALRGDASALWSFHRSLLRPPTEKALSWFETESMRAEAGEPLSIVPRAVADAAYATCRVRSLPMDCLRDQILAAARFVEPIRFETEGDLRAFVRLWAGSHARLLARLAGQTGRWQESAIQELARAFFLTGRLCNLQQDLDRDRLFIPLSALRQCGVTLASLRRGDVTEAVQRLFWRQTVRIRDAFAASAGFGQELSGWRRRVFRTHWLAGLYFLAEIERRKYDLWSQPLVLSGPLRLQLRIQALAGKAGFR